ncbi:biotin-dependent carboxyltransferase family protein [Streptomyces botrytidirepellens]|uniref:Biotin-dependent carboxyltransferase n=1 Tax=Streptomyces botrytidirepellens TaxID=2486417 RepID=A0A3M8W4K7_9ACTN|nr:biotin-dependent carboxyltransferase family protein [Streptomyces botrytidirepellens]RNG25048.1 biotin-dependent carboxyltransferase [Streptomyces botrytidirepellens]
MKTVAVEITSTGWITTFQDLGRRDTERRGVPTGGAADQHSAAVANLLVGNPRGATLIENLGGELAIVPDADVLLAVTGAPALVTVGGGPVESWSPLVVPAGHEVRVHGDVSRGTRTYLAVNGALTAETLLGSAAPDARMGFGQVVVRGSSVLLDTEFRGFSRRLFQAPLFRLPVPVPRFDAGPWDIDVVPTQGIHTIAGIREVIEEATYVVTNRSNHVGLRLDGPVLHPDTDTEIVSHGVPVGALQIPHADELIVLGRYRSLTAGYPIVGVASRASLSLLGQAGPGRELRFHWTDRESALRRFARREAEVRALEHAATEAFGALGFTAPSAPLSGTI